MFRRTRDGASVTRLLSSIVGFILMVSQSGLSKIKFIRLLETGLIMVAAMVPITIVTWIFTDSRCFFLGTENFATALNFYFVK